MTKKKKREEAFEKALTQRELDRAAEAQPNEANQNQVEPGTLTTGRIYGHLYLPEHEVMATALRALASPDLHRCQFEAVDTEHETFGPRPRVRCCEEPTVVAFQRRSTSDDLPTGAVALCDDHHILVEHMYPGQCYFRRVTRDKRIGEYI